VIRSNFCNQNVVELRVNEKLSVSSADETDVSQVTWAVGTFALLEFRLLLKTHLLCWVVRRLATVAFRAPYECTYYYLLTTT